MYSIKEENRIDGKWVEDATHYYHYYDTISWFKTKSENYRNGQLYSGSIVTPEYDDEGKVLRIIHQVSEGYNQPYRYRLKREYEYDEAGVCRAYTGWAYQNGAYILIERMFDIEWYDWQGFGNGFPLCYDFVGLANPEEYYSKMSYAQLIGYYENGDAYPYGERRTHWNIDGNNGVVDSLFHYFESAGRFCPVQKIARSYDDHGYYKSYEAVVLTEPDENGIQEIDQKYTWATLVETTYHPRYPGLWQRMESYESEYFNGVWDTDLFVIDMVEEYIATNYNYVAVPELPLPLPANQALSIAPNPVSGVVSISSAGEINRLQIFDIAGRLIKEEAVSADKAVFDTGNLPKGIYLVQALLKNGDKQTGKLVVK